MSIVDEKSQRMDAVERADHHESVDTVDEEFADDVEVSPEAIGGASTSDLPPGYYRSFNFIGTLVAIVFGKNALFLSGSMPLNVLTDINKDIGPNASFDWVAIIFSVLSASTFLLGGRLSDLIGRRWVYIGSTSIGTLGCVIAAAAPTIPALIVGAAFIGVHAGPQQNLLMLIAELVPNKFRPWVSSLVFNMALPLIAFGPVFIRLMIQNIGISGWRWSYGIAAIFNGVSLILLILCYHPPNFEMLHARSQKKVPAWKMVDFVGTILFLAGLTIFLLGLSWGGTVYVWNSGKVIGFLVAGAVLLIMFALWEVYGAGDYPLVPMHLLRNAAFMSLAFASGIATMTYFALLLIWPNQLSLLYDTSFMGVGLKSCVIQSGTSIGYLISSLVMKPLGKQKWQFVFGLIVLAAFMGGMAGTTPNTQTMALFFLGIVGASIGWIECIALTLAPFCLKHDELGIALGFVGTVRAGLAAAGQTIFTTIYTNCLKADLPKYVTPVVVQAGLPESSVPALLAGLAAGNLTGISGLTPAITAVAKTAYKEGYSHSFQTVYLSSIAFGVVGILTSLFAPNTERKLNSAISRKLHRRQRHKAANATTETSS
ncbi:hypothetical protein SEUCBS139899_009105 [Sporothrix eucalyptigena]|uniref:Major facilitator superfamily (MFS) profile domain-containing protein n=1 Tax=Sporothrix eucalyptigena TaxID=1812306 RepID=A0ABP0CN67_9PEZI